MNILKISRLIRQKTGAYTVLRKNILDFTYKSTKNNTICLINPKIKQILATEKILDEHNINYTLQANTDNNGVSHYYYIIQ